MIAPSPKKKRLLTEHQKEIMRSRRYVSLLLRLHVFASLLISFTLLYQTDFFFCNILGRFLFCTMSLTNHKTAPSFPSSPCHRRQMSRECQLFSIELLYSLPDLGVTCTVLHGWWREQKNEQQNNVPSPKKQRSCRLSGSSENRAFEMCWCIADFQTVR